MSTASLLTVFKTKVSWDVELRNAHGAAPCLWAYLCEKYFPGEASWVVNEQVLADLFALLNTDKLQPEERVGLALTADRGVIPKEYLSSAAKLINRLAEDITKWRGPEFVNHWPAIASFIERAATKIDGRAIGVAMNATSVGDTWDGYPKGITLFAVPEQYYVQEISSDK